jgi:exosome complex RNA-binding protein Rrp42 (RNase PH superfamily)
LLLLTAARGVSPQKSLAGSTFTIIYNDKKEICSVLKPGGTTLSDSTLKECMERAKARVDEVMPLLAHALAQSSAA